MTNLNLQIRWKNMDKDVLAEEYFYNKITKLLDFNFVNVDEKFKAEITYYAKSNKYKSSLSFAIKGRPDVHAKSNEYSNLQHSINELVEKTLDQLRRIKTQFKNN
ncbi:HPF/RaiA family ribosome-associated protein [[Mycoplasma] cavipharyngis]|uniref:HPF/RaiA family ribosome-associated protein n=1 Tax=[Mycoplasma] cavipharyngis TaxID=92757 RepID=UPI003703F3C3